MHQLRIDKSKVDVYIPDGDPKASLAKRFVIPEHQIVIKIWDDNPDFYSVKWWSGSLDHVVSHWRMERSDDPISDSDFWRVLDALKKSSITINKFR